jgi:hypothetical protein
MKKKGKIPAPIEKKRQAGKTFFNMVVEYLDARGVPTGIAFTTVTNGNGE